MEKALEYILKKFPDHGASMTDLYCTDEDFRILCEDYLTSMRTLEEYGLKGFHDRTFENEFLQLSLELEKEIFHLLRSGRK
jgi:hypothetical protein